jgi:hypothetical protein
LKSEGGRDQETKQEDHFDQETVTKFQLIVVCNMSATIKHDEINEDEMKINEKGK